MDWKEEVRKRSASFLTTHPLLTVIETLDDRARMQRTLFTQEWPFRSPILIKPGLLPINIPEQERTIENLARIIGLNHSIKVIDVKTQKEEVQAWTLRKWVDYYTSTQPHAKRYNLISLEFSKTPLRALCGPPELVLRQDWCENKSTRVDSANCVQCYFLSGVADCYTDYHVDFGGSSVYYQVLEGQKIFFLIPPTVKNLALFADWCKSRKQKRIFFADLCDSPPIKVTVEKGNMILLPSGWIHAVETPVNSVVIGGNFVHSNSIDTQIKVYHIEELTQVPYDCRFPSFVRLNWNYAKFLVDEIAKKQVDQNKTGNVALVSSLSPVQRRCLLALHGFLREWEELSGQIGIDEPAYYIESVGNVLKGLPLPQKEQFANDTYEPLFCYCRAPDGTHNNEKRPEWVACDHCTEWYHLSCLNMTITERDALQYYICGRCEPIVTKDFVEDLKKEKELNLVSELDSEEELAGKDYKRTKKRSNNHSHDTDGRRKKDAKSANQGNVLNRSNSSDELQENSSGRSPNKRSASVALEVDLMPVVAPILLTPNSLAGFADANCTAAPINDHVGRESKLVLLDEEEMANVPHAICSQEADEMINDVSQSSVISDNRGELSSSLGATVLVIRSPPKKLKTNNSNDAEK